MSEEQAAYTTPNLCECIDTESDIGKLAIGVGQRLPPGTFIDAHPCDYGDRLGISAKHLDGRRVGVRFKRDDFPTAEVIADLLRPKACTEHMPFPGHRTCAEWGTDDL